MKRLHSMNLSFHKVQTEQLVDGMQSLTSYRDDLQQLKDVHFEKNVDKVEYEYNSHRLDYKVSMIKKQSFSMTRADRQMVNSTKLSGHNSVTAAMPKVSHAVSAILHPPYTLEEEVMQPPETQ